MGKSKSSTQGTSPARLIRSLLADGVTVTVGGVPIMITLGEAQPVTPRRTVARAPVAAPKPRRKSRRRRSRRPTLPDPRDIRGFLATRMEGATLTILAQEFHVKRPLMKRMLARMVDRKEIVMFKGAFYNNKRLRQRRVPALRGEGRGGEGRAPLASVPDQPPEPEQETPSEPIALPPTGTDENG